LVEADHFVGGRLEKILFVRPRVAVVVESIAQFRRAFVGVGVQVVTVVPQAIFAIAIAVTVGISAGRTPRVVGRDALIHSLLFPLIVGDGGFAAVEARRARIVFGTGFTAIGPTTDLDAEVAVVVTFSV